MASRKEACNITVGIYRPRHLQVGLLHQCITRHYEELEAGGTSPAKSKRKS